MKKPDGLTIIPQEDLPGILLTLKPNDIPGIGDNMNIRLKRAGIHDMKTLWNLSPKHMRKIWGNVQGERLWYWLHGYDFEAPETGNVMIGHSRVLDPALRVPERARLMARRLLVKATYRLRRNGYHAAVLSLSVRDIGFGRWGHDIRITPAQDPFTFLNTLDVLWDEMMSTFSPHRIKKVSVALSDLKKPCQITHDLLDTSTPETLRILQRREALAAAMDKLQNKYHKETVWLGVTPKTMSGHVGTKIAFSRVPDREEFWG